MDEKRFPELAEIKREIATWPAWMQREARFEGEASGLTGGTNFGDSGSSI